MYKKTWFGQEVILPGPEVRLRVYVLKTITSYFMYKYFTKNIVVLCFIIPKRISCNIEFKICIN